MSEALAETIVRTLVRTPSVQTDAFEADPAVQAYLRTVVAGEASRLGLQTAVDPIGNVVIHVGPPGGPRVLLFAYAMTHPANRMVDAFDARLLTDGGGRRRLRGRGAAEQKGALAAALMACAALKRREPALRGQLVLCVSPAGETGRHDAAQAFLDGLGRGGFAWCIVAIGLDNAICVANKGRIDATITVRGTAGHSSMPWRATNAIAGAVEVLRRLAAIRPAGEHPHLGRATLTPTAIRSWPEATHTVPDEVRIVIDRRLLPGDDPTAALDEVRTALGGMSPWPVEVTPGPFMYPSEVAPGAPLVARLRAAFAAAGRPDPPLEYSHGCIDAGLFNVRGIPAVMLGPGEPSQWHTDDESVALADVALCAVVYAAAALA